MTLLLRLFVPAIVAVISSANFACAAEETKAPKDGAAAPAKSELKAFLISTKGTYGWKPVKGTISYDFFTDGRLHIQGPDGEATMWEGKWTLKGDQLTLTNSTEKTKETVTAKIDGEDLLLNEKRYKRERP